MITVVEGSQGSGKTMLMCYFAFLEHKERKMIYSNIEFPEMLGTTNYVFLESLEHFSSLNVSNGCLFIDEFTLWGGDSRSSSSATNKKLSVELILQCRKKNLQAVFSSQKFEYLDLRTRQQCDVLITCQKCVNKNGKLEPIISNIEISPEIEVWIKCQWINFNMNINREFSFHANPLFNKYDTKQIQKLQYKQNEGKKKK